MPSRLTDWYQQIFKQSSQLQGRFLLCYLDMTDQHVAADESRAVVCVYQLHLKVAICFLVVIPVNTVLRMGMYNSLKVTRTSTVCFISKVH